MKSFEVEDEVDPAIPGEPDLHEPEPFDIGQLGEVEYEQPEGPEEHEFQPWHRPRKQYVRKNQWLACLRDIFAGREADESIRYIGLPGSDLLDIRYFHETICAEQQRKIRFLGFHRGALGDSPEATSLSISLQQVKLSELVHERSQVLPDDFADIGSDNTRAYQEAVAAGPFDVINLDLCDSIAAGPPLGGLYPAMSRLLSIQVRNANPWLLYLTTRVGRDMIDPAVAEGLFSKVEQLTGECPDVMASIAEWAESLDPDSPSTDDCSDLDFFRTVLIGFCQWLAGLAQAQLPHKINVRAAFAYQVADEVDCPDMVSLAIRFVPVVEVIPDPDGLAHDHADDNNLDPCAVALQSTDRIAAAVDVDEQLRDSQDLRQEMIDQTRTLLAEARYDAAAFDDWATGYET